MQNFRERAGIRKNKGTKRDVGHTDKKDTKSINGCRGEKVQVIHERRITNVNEVGDGVQENGYHRTEDETCEDIDKRRNRVGTRHLSIRQEVGHWCGIKGGKLNIK